MAEKEFSEGLVNQSSDIWGSLLRAKQYEIALFAQNAFRGINLPDPNRLRDINWRLFPRALKDAAWLAAACAVTSDNPANYIRSLGLAIDHVKSIVL